MQRYENWEKRPNFFLTFVLLICFFYHISAYHLVETNQLYVYYDGQYYSYLCWSLRSKSFIQVTFLLDSQVSGVGRLIWCTRFLRIALLFVVTSWMSLLSEPSQACARKTYVRKLTKVRPKCGFGRTFRGERTGQELIQWHWTLIQWQWMLIQWHWTLIHCQWFNFFGSRPMTE